MSKKEPPTVLNMDSLETKKRLMAKIGTLKGLYEVTLKPRKRTRSLSQNAYYFSAFVTPFCEWLRSEWGDPEISIDQAHVELKKAVLGVREKLNERTGEMMELVPASHNKDTWEFSSYLEKAAEFLARACGIVVLPSELYFEKAEKANRPKETKSNVTSNEGNCKARRPLPKPDSRGNWESRAVRREA